VLAEEIMRKYLLLAALLMMAGMLSAQEQATDPRTEAGCGPASLKLDVKTNKKQHDQVQPESGKALVYVFSEYVSDPHYQTIGHVTTRIGMDGNWMGASHESSYLSFPADPGTHRICSDVQSIFAPKSLSAAADLNAEAGKIYYFRVVVKELHTEPIHMFVSPVDEAEGQLMLSNSALSISHPKK
jgi:hypothetical protein